MQERAAVLFVFHVRLLLMQYGQGRIRHHENHRHLDGEK